MLVAATPVIARIAVAAPMAYEAYRLVRFCGVGYSSSLRPLTWSMVMPFEWPLCQPLNCRHVAAETPHHGPARPRAAQHPALANPWIAQHNRAGRAASQTTPT
jgi:hypothetical protein